jgi:hypothetical protein
LRPALRGKLLNLLRLYFLPTILTEAEIDVKTPTQPQTQAQTLIIPTMTVDSPWADMCLDELNFAAQSKSLFVKN